MLALCTMIIVNSCADAKKPNSNFKGVQIGVISYSWRSMPGDADDILNYCLRSGISSIELMGDVAERYAGIPSLPDRPARGDEMTEAARAAYDRKVQESREKQREWRLSVSMDKFAELGKMYNDSGVKIHIVKFSPAGWSDEEIDYAFKAAKAMGAAGITNEIGHDACQRLGRFAEKHDMYAIYHNHGQPGEPGFNFEEFLEYSPKNMLNLDVGHYFGATGKHPNEIIEKLHDRIFSIHLKDKTGKDSEPANTNMPWGEGETPLADILNLIRENQWPIYCDIELEYPVPDDSDAVKETTKCVDYCREVLSGPAG
jgi:sugar phosphate isomerase/epimerase